MLGKSKVDTKKAAAFLGEHYPIIGILIASFLISASMGIYTNWDAQLEFEATTSITNTGFPYLSTGLMINQPPLGFYTSALILQLYGISYPNGMWVSTAFGVTCVAAVYALGAVSYGKKTGLVAAALFGIIPWHIYLSRIFLIDNQCLFLSLVFLTVGVLAVKRNSEKLFALAGVFFALALLTKLFAVIALIPLVLTMYLNRKENSFKISRRTLILFLLPTLILQVLWFGGLAHQNFLGVYFPTDFTHPILVPDPQLGFLPIIFVKSCGWFLFAAITLSVGITIGYRRQFSELLRFDIALLGTIAAVMVLDMILVFGFHLTVPYVSVVKYNYFLLPLFCLLAASVIDKGKMFFGTRKKQWINPAFIGAGIALLFASLLESTLYLNTWTGFVSFGVDSVTYYGFEVYSETLSLDVLIPLHFGALSLMVASLFFPKMVAAMKRSLKTLHTALTS
jgi:4-amino-4-deoxy-L-arabinose transferase-like glycosyltransferase